MSLGISLQLNVRCIIMIIIKDMIARIVIRIRLWLNVQNIMMMWGISTWLMNVIRNMVTTECLGYDYNTQAYDAWRLLGICYDCICSGYCYDAEISLGIWWWLFIWISLQVNVGYHYDSMFGVWSWCMNVIRDIITRLSFGYCYKWMFGI